VLLQVLQILANVHYYIVKDFAACSGSVAWTQLLTDVTRMTCQLQYGQETAGEDNSCSATT